MKRLKQKFVQFLEAHPSFRSGLRVATYTFISMFGLSLGGFLVDVQSWATSAEAAEFPSVAPLGKAAVAALVSALSGLSSFIWNKLPRTVTAQYPKAIETTARSGK